MHTFASSYLPDKTVTDHRFSCLLLRRMPIRRMKYSKRKMVLFPKLAVGKQPVYNSRNDFKLQTWRRGFEKGRYNGRHVGGVLSTRSVCLVPVAILSHGPFGAWAGNLSTTAELLTNRLEVISGIWKLSLHPQFISRLTPGTSK